MRVPTRKGACISASSCSLSAMQKMLTFIFQNDILATTHEEFLERQMRKEEELRAETVRTDWCYGPHKLTYVELKKAS